MKINIKSLNSATITTIISIVVLTILSELSAGFKNLLSSISGHHWVTKSILSVTVFILAYALSSKKQKDFDLNKIITKTLLITIAGSLIIFLFYVYEFFA